MGSEPIGFVFDALVMPLRYSTKTRLNASTSSCKEKFSFILNVTNANVMPLIELLCISEHCLMHY